MSQAEIFKPTRHVVWINKHAAKPAWLAKPPEFHSGALARRAGKWAAWNSYRYWSLIWERTPLWATREPVAAIYNEAALRRAAGDDVTVDHVVPLSSNLVAGLHWHGNLAIITRRANAHKSNRHWPDMPESQDSFGFYS